MPCTIRRPARPSCACSPAWAARRKSAVPEALLAARRGALRRGQGGRRGAARRPRRAGVLAGLPAGRRPDPDRHPRRRPAAGRGAVRRRHREADRRRPARDLAGGAGDRAPRVPCAEPEAGRGAAGGGRARHLDRVRRVRGRLPGPRALRPGRRSEARRPGADPGQPAGRFDPGDRHRWAKPSAGRSSTSTPTSPPTNWCRCCSRTRSCS